MCNFWIPLRSLLSMMLLYNPTPPPSTNELIWQSLQLQLEWPQRFIRALNSSKGKQIVVRFKNLLLDMHRHQCQPQVKFSVQLFSSTGCEIRNKFIHFWKKKKIQCIPSGALNIFPTNSKKNLTWYWHLLNLSCCSFTFIFKIPGILLWKLFINDSRVFFYRGHCNTEWAFKTLSKHTVY